jgi:phosphatidate cytidylyltransferase
MGFKRVLTAVVFIPLFYILVKYLPPLFFFLFVAAGIVIGLYEFYRFHYGPVLSPSIRLGLVLGVLVALGFYRHDLIDGSTLIVAMVLMILLFHLFFSGNLASSLVDSSVVLFGLAYVGWFLGHLILIRGFDDGGRAIFFLFLVTWAGDTGAYYVGTAIGRHKLSPRVSPNKTLEGAVGGAVMSAIAALVARAWFFPALNRQECLVLGVVLGVLGQLGDLAESMFKRGAGVKDSGDIVPAHGGLLDRVDSLIFTAPVFYYYLVLVKSYGQAILI